MAFSFIPCVASLAESRSKVSVFEILISKTEDTENYMRFDRFLPGSFQMEIAERVFPDKNDSNISIESYTYEYIAAIVSGAVVKATIKTDKTYYPELEKKLEEVGTECVEKPSDKIAKTYRTEFPSAILDVDFLEDGKVEYTWYVRDIKML